MVQDLLDHVRPALEASGDADEVAALVGQTLAGGNGATRQRAAFSRRQRMEDVVDFLLEQTSAACG